MTAILIFGVFLTAVGRGGNPPPPADDVVLFGSDYLRMPHDYPILNRGDQAAIAAEFKKSRPIKAGRPFRAGVEFVKNPRLFGEPFLVHLNDVYDYLGGNAGFFVDRVETEHDFRSLISQVGDHSDHWPSPAELRYVLDRADKAPKGIPIRVLTKDFNADVLARGCVRAGTAWLAAYVDVSRGGDVEEVWTAFDANNRMAYRCHGLIKGASPFIYVEALSGRGTYAGGLAIQPSEPRALKTYLDTGSYVLGLIAEAKKRCKK
jgi:hypothetical protein